MTLANFPGLTRSFCPPENQLESGWVQIYSQKEANTPLLRLPLYV